MIHVAVGVIRSPDRQRVLISRRAAQAHQGGLWEFPGGKVEPGEDVLQALRRELREELDLEPIDTTPLCRIAHDYGDRQVLLDVWIVDDWSGTPRAMESQPLRWTEIDRLEAADFPVANRAIIRSLRLTDTLVITPAADDPVQAMTALQQRLRNNDGLIQLRQPQLDVTAFQQLLTEAAGLPAGARRRMLLNTRPEDPMLQHFGGCHLSARFLRICRQRPVRDDQLFGASCHSRAELEQAVALEADYATLSPVQRTASHPQANPLGWTFFHELIRELDLPVYALGGMRREDMPAARQHGARGLAGIRFIGPDQLR